MEIGGQRLLRLDVLGHVDYRTRELVAYIVYESESLRRLVPARVWALSTADITRFAA